LWVLLAGISLSLALDAAPAKVEAQEAPRHVVSPQELSRAAAQPRETRQANEAAVRHLLHSEPGQQALKSANVDYARVDKAIGQLSDEDLARLAERSRQAESDFAAGFLSPKHLAEIILVVVVIVVIIVLV
jgi:hypothetical protein